MTFRYRIERGHDPYEEYKLEYERRYYECEEHDKELLNRLTEKGFEFVTEVHVSVAYEYFEIMVDTNRKLTEEELQNLLKYFKPAVCTNSWEY